MSMEIRLSNAFKPYHCNFRDCFRRNWNDGLHIGSSSQQFLMSSITFLSISAVSNRGRNCSSPMVFKLNTISVTTHLRSKYKYIAPHLLHVVYQFLHFVHDLKFNQCYVKLRINKSFLSNFLIVFDK